MLYGYRAECIEKTLLSVSITASDPGGGYPHPVRIRGCPGPEPYAGVGHHIQHGLKQYNIIYTQFDKILTKELQIESVLWI